MRSRIDAEVDGDVVDVAVGVGVVGAADNDYVGDGDDVVAVVVAVLDHFLFDV